MNALRLPSSLRPHALALACASLLGAVAPAALAQPADAVAETVVITGTVRQQKLMDLPFAISVVDAQALRNGGPMINLSEALGGVPGLVVNNRSNYAQDLQISSRGFGARAGFGVRGLRLYSDGIPASMPDGQGQVAHFDLAGAQRVEVLRGPFSVLYGNSSGGVIALFSAPISERRFELGLDAGSFGLAQARASVSAPLAGGFDIGASASLMEIDGFRPESDAKRSLGNVRLGWRGEADRVLLLVSDQNQKAQDPLGLDWTQFSANPRQTTPQATQFDTRKTIRQTQAGLSWKHSFSGAGPLTESSVSAYRGSRGVTQWLAIAAATQAAVGHGGGVIDFDRIYQGLDARLNWHWDTLDLVTGINQEEQTDDRRGYENFTGTGAAQLLGVVGKLRRQETNQARTSEAYAQAEWTLAPQWAATGGVRSGKVKLSTEDAYLSNGNDSGALSFNYSNPVLGLRWRPSDALSLHLSAARGFESPTLGELAYSSSAINSGFNLGLKGQTSRQLELGAKWRTAMLDLDAALFEARTENEIGVRTNSGGRQSFQNVGRTQRRGAEAGATWRVQPGLRAQLSLSLLDATYLDNFNTCTTIPCDNKAVPAGNRIAGTQRASGFAQVAWRPAALPVGEWALEWRGVARTAANDVSRTAGLTRNDFAPGYALAHLRWTQQWPLAGSGLKLELLGRIDNLLNRSYVGSVIVNDANGRYYEPGTPRAYLLGARVMGSF